MVMLVTVTGVGSTVPDRCMVGPDVKRTVVGERGLRPRSRKEYHVSGCVEQVLDTTAHE